MTAGILRLLATSLGVAGALWFLGRSLGGEVPPPMALGLVGGLLVLAALLGPKKRERTDAKEISPGTREQTDAKGERIPDP